jgi:hypothetical protein
MGRDRHRRRHVDRDVGRKPRRAIHVAFPAVSLSYPSLPSFHHDNPRPLPVAQCLIVPSATPSERDLRPTFFAYALGLPRFVV